MLTNDEARTKRRNIVKQCILSLAILLGFSLPAQAQVTEIRGGVHQHDIEIFGLGGKKGKETSASLNAEIICGKPEFLDWALSPSIYAGGSVNLEGNTSYGGGGLMWRQGFSDRFYGDFAFGLVVHDGTLEVDLPSYFDDPVIAAALEGNGTLTPAQLDRINQENIPYLARLNNEIEFGSRILFRQGFALGYRVNDDWAGEIYFEHLSHGKILSSRSNEGLDSLGIRISRRFE